MTAREMLEVSDASDHEEPPAQALLGAGEDEDPPAGGLSPTSRWRHSHDREDLGEEEEAGAALPDFAALTRLPSSKASPKALEEEAGPEAGVKPFARLPSPRCGAPLG